MSIERLTGSRRRVVAGEWTQAFPGFGAMLLAGAPMLARIIGPLTQGIVLDSFPDLQTYRVVTFVHFLGRPLPAVAFQLDTEARSPNGSAMILRVRSHPAGVRDAVEAIRTQSPLPLAALPTFDQVAEAYRHRIDSTASQGFASFRPLEDLILLAAMFGRSDLVDDTILRAATLSATWPMERLPHGYGWLADVKAQASVPEHLWATVPREIQAHKLDRIPSFDLV